MRQPLDFSQVVYRPGMPGQYIQNAGILNFQSRILQPEKLSLRNKGEMRNKRHKKGQGFWIKHDA